MKVVLYYDISTEASGGGRRLRQILKICRKYLHHVQKSVFEGELTEGQIEALKTEILKVVDRTKDSVVIYIFPASLRVKREILTLTEDRTGNII